MMGKRRKSAPTALCGLREKERGRFESMILNGPITAADERGKRGVKGIGDRSRIIPIQIPRFSRRSLSPHTHNRAKSAMQTGHFSLYLMGAAIARHPRHNMPVYCIYVSDSLGPRSPSSPNPFFFPAAIRLIESFFAPNRNSISFA